MKITHNKVGQNLNVRDSGVAEKSDKSRATSAIDANDMKANALDKLGATNGVEASRVNLSSRAQDIKRISELAKAAPDVDEAKVARLQSLIDKGEYKVDAEKIAGKMIDEQASWE